MLFAAIAAALWFFVSPQVFDLSLVADYSGDGMAHGFIIKTILDVGWHPVHTPSLGAPFGMDLSDYPYSDSLNFLLIRFFGLFTSDWIVVSNLFYLASYFFAGVTAYIVLRRFGIASAWALAGALLFAFLPFHWLRRIHLFLANYGVAPLGVWLAFIAWRRDSESPSFSPRYLGRALLVLIIGTGGAYYAAFSAFLVAVAGLGRALAERSARQGVPALAIVVGIAAVVGIQAIPTVVYRHTHGPNPQAAARLPVESEIYGLRLTQLVLPHSQHRVGAMRNVAARYASSAPLVNENATASLGFAGTFGLAFLALFALTRLAGGSAIPSTISFLALLAIACFLLGTIGGGGALFAYTVTPLLRGLNRISVFIGFIALAGLVLALQSAIARSRFRAPLWSIVGAFGLAILGTLDQTPRDVSLRQDLHLESDREFMAAAESLLAPGTLVWQLPYHTFPEGGPLHLLQDYGLMRGYLNSSTLRWSYGAVKGRPADLWFRSVAAHPLREQLELAARSGFGAVYIDRRGYADNGAAAEKTLREILGRPLVESRDGSLALYRLTPLGTGPLPLEDVLPPLDATIRFDAQTLDTVVTGTEGLSHWEVWGRWSEGSVVQIRLARSLPLRFALRIDTVTALPPSAGVDLIARVGNVERAFKVGSGETVVEIPFDLPAPAKRIEIVIPNARSPRELGINEDGRKLGIALRSITILPQPATR